MSTPSQVDFWVCLKVLESTPAHYFKCIFRELKRFLVCHKKFVCVLKLVTYRIYFGHQFDFPFHIYISGGNVITVGSRQRHESRKPWMRISELNLKLGQRPILVEKGPFLKKKNTKNITIPYSNPFLSVLHQNKALHNFHKREQRTIAGWIKGLD